jgi:hypothetical protein
MIELRVWLKSLLERPVIRLHERIDGVKSEFNHDLEALREDMEHRARRLEIVVTAWGATAALLVCCGLFLLMGLWLALSRFIGSVGASFALTGLFGLLAMTPMILLPKELAREDASHAVSSKTAITAVSRRAVK